VGGGGAAKPDVVDLRDDVHRNGGEILAMGVADVASGEGTVRVELPEGNAVVAHRLVVAGAEGPWLDRVVTDAARQVVGSVDDGVRLGALIADELDEAEARAATTSSQAADWDARYSGELLWSGNPNGSLVVEVGGLAPGRALDVGAGEGGDAVWLAEQGWQVTASDISTNALARIDALAAQRGLSITCLQADANGDDPYPRAAFDLVTASYASIPRTPDGRAVRAVVDAVAPGGTLVVLSHDVAAMRDPSHGHRPFDPEAYVQVEHFAAALADDPGWTIEVHELRPRPAGAASAAHHADDLVLRARRAH
ncbi:MAG: class I SAM-dependent methyltransferase, partial [Jatrophihabitans sp.]|uniref:class I SAM-dependent methyltransferase n=1 Tax=Jatrophihabitans sp. TaxID=1932789 RepID=UPI003F7E0141